MTEIPKFAFPFRRSPLVQPALAAVTNCITNPGAKVNTSDWSVQGSGSEVLAQAGYGPGNGPPGTTDTAWFKGTVGSANTRWHFTPGMAVVPGDVIRFAGWARRMSGTDPISWRIARPGFSSVASYDPAAAGANNWIWGEVEYTAVAAETLSIYLHTSSSDEIQWDRMILTKNDTRLGTLTSDEYFDGSSAGAAWNGTANLSTSTLAPVAAGLRPVVQVEQDSLEHIDACAQVVIRCPLGFRDERPEFGWPFPEFGNIPLDVEPLEEALQRFGHPNGEASASEYGDIIDQSIRYMRVVERAHVDARRETE